MNVFKMDILAENGIRFRAVLLVDGVSENYGKLNDSGDAEIEFYDTRYPHTSDGQFTGARYYAKTLLNDRGWYPNKPRGLNLHGGIEAYTLDEDSFEVVLNWMTTILDRS